MLIFGRRDPARLDARGDITGLARLSRQASADTARGDSGERVDVGYRRRADAVRRLAAYPGEPAETAIREALGDGSAEVRAAAVCALAARRSIVDDAVVRVALEVDGTPRAEVAAALADAVPEQRMGLLAAYVGSAHDPDSTFGRPWVEAVLEGMPSEDVAGAVDMAVTALLSPVGTARAREVVAARPDVAVDRVVDRVEEPEYALAAIEELGRLRHTGGVEALRAALRSNDPVRREAAARALGTIRHPSSIDALIEATLDMDFDVRDAAMQALDAFGSAGAAWSLAMVAQGVVASDRAPVPVPRTDRPVLEPGSNGRSGLRHLASKLLSLTDGRSR